MFVIFSLSCELQISIELQNIGPYKHKCQGSRTKVTQEQKLAISRTEIHL